MPPSRSGARNASPTPSGPEDTRTSGRAASSAPARRGRLPATDLAHVTAAAHSLLVSSGVDAVTLRAVARVLGVTAPALYRYVDSREQLLAELAVYVQRDAVDAIGRARDAAPPDPGARMMAAARGFRAWALAHPVEFGVAFGQPADAGVSLAPEQPLDSAPRVPLRMPVDAAEAPAGVRFAAVFAGIYAEMWAATPLQVRPDHQIERDFGRRLERYRQAVGLDDLPLDAVRQFLGGWVRIFGMVAIEVFGHLRFVLDDAEPLFEAELADLLGR